jgi:hypothetical protein
MPSGRLFNKQVFLSAHYESQDVLSEIDDLDLICLETGRGYDFKEAWQRRLLFHDVSRRLVFQNPGLKKVRLTRDYDLFVARCQHHIDFLNVNAIEGWKDRCKVSVCWLDELWAADIPSFRYWIHALARFDHVFVGCRGSVEPLSQAIGKQCHWLPGAVDALRFSPYPNAPERVVDVYSMGRRSQGIHDRIFHASASGSLFYLHDTFGASLSRVYDYQQHRIHFANIAKRSKFFLVAPGKVNSPGETRRQEEVGHRYFEGAASGAVMIGQIPRSDSYGELFPWGDAVAEVNSDGSDVMSVIASLSSAPERMAAIGHRNAREALLHHDWVYRWKEILRVAGLEPRPQMAAREQLLQIAAHQSSSHTEPLPVQAR